MRRLARRGWQRWQEGLRGPLDLPEILPALRLLLVLDNLAGHLSQALVGWRLTVGILPLYTPLGGSWLNMAESFQRILKRRPLQTQHPQSSAEIITRLEQTAAGWNRGTPRPLSGAAGGPNAAGASACAGTGSAGRALTPAVPCAGAPRGPTNGNHLVK
jgi:hypothetical protein